ncbi:DUF6332 family protein [Streptomyces tropicalis]|uniref:DUF6332 family protein n=1 Tax=Streptomyces tropicalis TaxID=3034234 RepID=A0ABT6A6D9_9ACTN|nr:DUF6332 family protein [Streptomyces tropicalis]MDF3300211.1 DUF6332 family protein [Streptomyces tropicalis]
MTTGRRSQAERDAITVEIGYALVSAGFLGAVVFGVVAGPAYVWDLPPTVEKVTPMVAAPVAGILAVARVVQVLWRHGERSRRG